MKKIILSIFALVLCFNLVAQAPNKFGFQAIVRDAANNLVASKPVGVKISILEESASGAEIYVETHTPTTNQNGLISFEIGGGTVSKGVFSDIYWLGDVPPYFVKSEIDPNGGTNYTISSTSQLISVPYALAASESNYSFISTLTEAVKGDNNFIPKYTSLAFPNSKQTTGNSNLYSLNNYLGINNTAPTKALDVESNNYYTARFKSKSTTDGTSSIGIENNNAKPSTWLIGVGGKNNGLGISDNQFYIEQVGTGAKMIIDSNGGAQFVSLGVGIFPTPGYKLDLLGNARIQGTLSTLVGVETNYLDCTKGNGIVIANKVQYTDGSTISQMQVGTINVGTSFAKSSEVLVGLPKAYPNTDYKVFLTLEGITNGNPDHFSMQVVGANDPSFPKSNATFTIKITRIDGNSWGNTTLKIHWMTLATN